MWADISNRPTFGSVKGAKTSTLRLSKAVLNVNDDFLRKGPRILPTSDLNPDKPELKIDIFQLCARLNCVAKLGVIGYLLIVIPPRRIQK